MGPYGMGLAGMPLLIGAVFNPKCDSPSYKHIRNLYLLNFPCEKIISTASTYHSDGVPSLVFF